ncbi:hypothetical protein EMCRGX_G019504 [Ephydatia muelleri]
MTNEKPSDTLRQEVDNSQNNQWDRLLHTPTLASTRRRAEVLIQPESLAMLHGRVLKNRPERPDTVTLERKELVTHQEPRKTTLHSCKSLAIESHHSEATNRGYSRKHDGGFYST